SRGVRSNEEVGTEPAADDGENGEQSEQGCRRSVGQHRPRGRGRERAEAEVAELGKAIREATGRGRRVLRDGRLIERLAVKQYEAENCRKHEQWAETSVCRGEVADGDDDQCGEASDETGLDANSIRELPADVLAEHSHGEQSREDIVTRLERSAEGIDRLDRVEPRKQLREERERPSEVETVAHLQPDEG